MFSDFFLAQKMFYKKILIMFTQLCEYTKKHWTIIFKWVDFMECEIYPIKL